ncbi:protein NRT1/ PTR FAMILY 2.8 [Bidens hawaiensis]|uniref:protein NRT1/ PTR FAMILY 2.8 n=1 Tax=Bidens hawaiensis TaxID=980011 RepID=UPI0040499984
MEKEMAAPPKHKGGWRSIRYIIGNESFEKLASMSLVMNMTVYLRSNYNMSGIFLVNVVTIWIGTSNIWSLAGAFISDAYIGKYRTLLYASIASLLGMGMMTLTAGVPSFRPPKCTHFPNCIMPENWQLGLLFTGLGLLAFGAGGLRPCGIAFGADQFNTTTAKGRKQLTSFFNLWYLSFTLALIIALTGVVYIQTNISWVIGFAIPTACLLFSLIVFLIGRDTYIMKKPEGSVFSDIVKVIFASFKKRDITYDHVSKHSFYHPQQESNIVRTQRFKCLDKAAMIIDPNELNTKGVPENKWRLCSVQQVENFKCVVGILPIWVSGVGCMLVIDQQSTFGVLQAIQMTRTIGSKFEIPPGWMIETAMVTLSVWIFIYEGIYVPKLMKLLKRDTRLTMVMRVRIGIIMSILCMVTAGIIERKRRESALNSHAYVAPLHVFWLIPQFMLSGLTEAFDSVAMMEFFTTQMPESMRTVASAIFFITLSVSSYLSSLIVNIIHKLTGKKGMNPWLGGHDLNRNRLDYYYYIIAGLGVLNLIYFTFVGSKFLAPAKVIAVEEMQEVEEGGNLSRGYHEL